MRAVYDALIRRREWIGQFFFAPLAAGLLVGCSPCPIVPLDWSKERRDSAQKLASALNKVPLSVDFSNSYSTEVTTQYQKFNNDREMTCVVALSLLNCRARWDSTNEIARAINAVASGSACSRPLDGVASAGSGSRPKCKENGLLGRWTAEWYIKNGTQLAMYSKFYLAFDVRQRDGASIEVQETDRTGVPYQTWPAGARFISKAGSGNLRDSLTFEYPDNRGPRLISVTCDEDGDIVGSDTIQIDGEARSNGELRNFKKLER